MTSTIHVKPGESERPALLLREYVESVNAWDVDRAFSVLQGAKVTVPHGTNVAETMEGEKVKEWLEHRIVKQRAKVRLTGVIDVDGNTARAELVRLFEATANPFLCLLMFSAFVRALQVVRYRSLSLPPRSDASPLAIHRFL
jgi:hypothetical protein